MIPPMWLGLVVAGAVGAPLRHLVARAVADRTGDGFPWGTVVVNATGSLVLGVVAGLALRHTIPDPVRVLLGTGLCGAYTTFSTASVDTIELLEQDGPAAAARNALGTLVLCTLAAGVGLTLTR